MLLGGDTQLVVEGVVPDLLHVVPVSHDAWGERRTTVSVGRVLLGL